MMEGGWGVEEVGVEEWDAISAVLQTHERQAVPSPASASAVAGSTPAATSHSISVSTSGSGVAPPVQTKARGGGEDGKLPGLGGLEDRLKVGLDLVIVRIAAQTLLFLCLLDQMGGKVGDNPGLASAGSGHHYAHPSNHFWRLLHESGLLPVPLSPSEDTKITSYGVRILLIGSSGRWHPHSEPRLASRVCAPAPLAPVQSYLRTS